VGGNKILCRDGLEREKKKQSQDKQKNVRVCKVDKLASKCAEDRPIAKK
jgi:hypothetical protein